MPINITDILNASAFRQMFEKVGELKFWPITAGSFAELQKELVAPEQFSPREIVLKLMYSVATRIDPDDEQQKGPRLDQLELQGVSDAELEDFSQEYIFRHPELVYKETARVNGLTRSQYLRNADLRKKKREKFMEYLARAVKGYIEAETARMVDTLRGFSSAYQDLFAANEQLSNKIGVDVRTFIHEPAPIPSVVKNPNLSKLGDIAGAMERLVNLNRESVQLVASMNDLQRQAGLEFAASARQSDRNAKIATIIAVTSLIVSMLFSGMSLYENNKTSKQNDALIRALMERNIDR